MAFTFAEFFAGAGMARIGLGSRWQCVFANDLDPVKAESYRTNFEPATELLVGDVASLKTSDVPDEQIDLFWASFPCQDLSLAGNGVGLAGARSGTFWPFWKLVRGLEGRAAHPSLVMIENVYGTLTSHGGSDFAALCNALVEGGYRVGAMLVDAAHFVPQSRVRLFVLAVREDIEVPVDVLVDQPNELWHPEPLVRAVQRLNDHTKQAWNWWRLPAPSGCRQTLRSVIEDEPADVRWHTKEETSAILEMMSDVNRKKIELAARMGRRVVATVYKRTRRVAGSRIQRAEVRTDGIAGCLRTPSGGSSRQTILLIDGASIKSRLLSAREAARLMGLPDTYRLPRRYNDAYHIAGDGVAVPVVSHLGRYLMEPILLARRDRKRTAA